MSLKRLLYQMIRFIFAILISLSVAISTMNPVAADDGITPPAPASPEELQETSAPLPEPTSEPSLETTPVPSATETPESEEQTPAPTGEPDGGEEENPILQQIPDQVNLVLLDLEGNPQPLVELAGSDTTLEGDPWFCPAGVAWNPDHIGCTTHLNLVSALNEISVYGSGTIYIEPGNFLAVDYDFCTVLNCSDPANENTWVDIFGGIDLSTGQKSASATIFPKLIFRNFNSNGHLLLENITIDDGNSTDEVALEIDTSKNVTLKDIIIGERNTGHALKVTNSQGNVRLQNITISEDGNGNGVLVTNGRDVVLDNITITEKGNGDGARLMQVLQLVIRNSNILEEDGGSALFIGSATSPVVRDSVIKSKGGNDPVVDVEDGISPVLENLTITHDRPSYVSGAWNTAVMFFNVRGEVRFNHNSLYITQSASPYNTNYFNGLGIYRNYYDYDPYSLVFLGTGNYLDGGNLGTTSNAVFVDASLTGASLDFHWNTLCNWSQGYFKNNSTILVNAINNSYCPNPPTHEGATPNIRGLVTYLPVATNDDVDEDGVPNLQDTCPTIANPGEAQTADLDGDGTPDACDNQDNRDSDGDGVQNWQDTCPLVSNPGTGQTTDTDADSTPDACDPTPNGDDDGDGVDNLIDTCRYVSNPGASQFADLDADGTPDACDDQDNRDSDGDGYENWTDSCPLVSNPGIGQTTDSDGDGTPDACDQTPNGDTDGDGVDNLSDVCPGFNDLVDMDGDGTPDGCDLTPNGDTDNDGVDNLDDVCPGYDDLLDTDSDGNPDGCDATPNGDTDGDGVDNLTDLCPGQNDTLDQDMDGTPDGCDATPNGDTDNDGVDNLTDNCPAVANPSQTDSDGDGVGDACEPVQPGGGNGKDQNNNPTGGYIPVTGLLAENQTCMAASVLKLTDGSQVTLPQIPCGYAANAVILQSENLPAAVPDGYMFISGLQFSVADLQLLSGSMTAEVSFAVSDPDRGWAVFYWQVQGEAGGSWLKLTGVVEDGFFKVPANFTGIFILVAE